MTDFFNFEAAEFQVLEEFEFDETVEREERVRFYTLQEQTTDAYNKFLPPGHVSTYKLKELEKEIAKLKDLYETYIVPEADTYRVREPVYAKRIPWVFPVYSNREWQAYDFRTAWAPLFSPETRRLPNAYPRLLDALPKPYVGGTPVERAVEFLDSNGRNPARALPNVTLVRTQRHEDGTFDVIAVERPNTADTLPLSGYYLAARGVDVPNPLEGHPFFENAEPHFVETPRPLSEVFPQIEAIVDHGVPPTSDPYRVGMSYLRVYDVRLSDIPWNVWRQKFPPAESLEETPEVVALAFPKRDQLAPPESLIRDYRSPYAPGLSNRFWLMRQLDGGEYQIRRLLSDVVSAGGSVPLPPLPALENITYPDTTPDAPECVLTNKTFLQFQVQGTMRGRLDKGRMVYKCVPVDFVLQERSRLGYLNRIPWTEATPTEIIRTYQEAMKSYMMPLMPPTKEVPEARTAESTPSQQRQDVVAVLEDPRRFPDDKLYDINQLLQESMRSGEIYKDPEGKFVLCAHTLALLAGDLNKDRKAFHEKWTNREVGYRVCKFCGERVVSEDYEDAEEYTDEGFLVRRTQALGEVRFQAEGAALALSGIQALRPLFNLDNPCDAMVYLLLTLLQVVPDGKELNPILLAGRGYAADLGDSDAAKKAQGAVGVATAAFLLQTHLPPLVPRRSFGPRPIKMSGYPRDRDTPEDFTTADSLLSVLQKTFRAYPGTIKDATALSIRSLLSNPTVFKKKTLELMDDMIEEYPDLRRKLDAAKTYVAAIPPVETPPVMLPAVPTPVEGSVRSFPDCSAFRAFWTGPHEPSVVQPPLELRRGIQASPLGRPVEVPRSVRATGISPAAAVVARMLKKGIPAALKGLEITDDWQRNIMIVSRLKSLFGLELDFQPADPAMDASLRRDYAKGLVYEALHEIAGESVRRNKFKELLTQDITLYILFSDVQVRKREYNSARARERKAYTDKSRAMTDLEREIKNELVRLGLSAPLISPEERKGFAEEIEEEPTDEEVAREADAMFGGPQEDTHEEENFRDDEGMVTEQELPDTDMGI